MKAKLTQAGMVAVLSGPFGQKAVKAAAQNIAGAVSATSHDGPVAVVVETHDAKLSAAASVRLDHPGGYAIEAKHAPLFLAATGQGYVVKGGAS